MLSQEIEQVLSENVWLKVGVYAITLLLLAVNAGPFDGFCGFFAANEADKELFELQDPFKDWFKPG